MRVRDAVRRRRCVLGVDEAPQAHDRLAVRRRQRLGVDRALATPDDPVAMRPSDHVVSFVRRKAVITFAHGSDGTGRLAATRITTTA
jgi:hypothetical protein